MTQLDSEIVEIIGLRSASGASSAKLFKDKPWHFTMTFTHWRINGGPLQTGRLFASKELVGREGQGWRKTFPPLTVVRLHATIREDEWNDGMVRTTLVEPLDPVPDPELDAISADLKAPVIVKVDKLGELRLNRAFGSFVGTVEWMGQDVLLYLPAKDDALDSAEITFAQSYFADQAKWDLQMRAYAADQLLKVKNENWLAEDEAPLTRDEFIRRPRPESVSLTGPNNFTVYYADDDIFSGHVIIVEGTIEDGSTRAHMAG